MWGIPHDTPRTKLVTGKEKMPGNNDPVKKQCSLRTIRRIRNYLVRNKE